MWMDGAAQRDFFFTLLAKGHNKNPRPPRLRRLQTSIRETHPDGRFETPERHASETCLPPAGLIPFSFSPHKSGRVNTSIPCVCACVCVPETERRRSSIFRGSRPYNSTCVVNTGSPAKFSHLSLRAGAQPDSDIGRAGGGAF